MISVMISVMVRWFVCLFESEGCGEGVIYGKVEGDMERRRAIRG